MKKSSKSSKPNGAQIPISAAAQSSAMKGGKSANKII